MSRQVFHIGRDFEAPVKIDDLSVSVSHDHATIIIENGHWTLHDNNSTNGTFVEEDGVFRRIGSCTIYPHTWIRLGEEGHRGCYFRARRVLKPNNYFEDFQEIYHIYEKCEETKVVLESRRRLAKWTAPVLMVLGLCVSTIPMIQKHSWGMRLAFLIPGSLSPLIQDLLLSKLDKQMKFLQKGLICPKCRRPLSVSDIISRNHTFCKAH